MEALNEWPYIKTADNVLRYRPWLRMHHFTRSGPLDSDPDLSAAGSLLHQDKRCLKDVWSYYWPSVPSGPKPQNGRYLRADCATAEGRKVRCASKATDASAWTPRLSQPMASTPPVAASQRYERSVSPSSWTSSSWRPDSDGPTEGRVTAMSPVRTRFRAHDTSFAQAAPVAKCREAYERLPEFEKVRGPKLASKSKQDFNPYLNYGLDHYDDALRESKELMMKYVEALSKRRDLTATVIVLSLQTLQDKLAQIFPPLQLSKLQWPECGTMDATSFDISDTWRQPFSVEPAFLAALRRLDTTLQRLAHELETDGGFFKTPWPAMVTVGRVEALMVINISQLQYVAASVLRLEVGDCGERPLGSEEVAAAAAARKASLRAAKAKRQRTEVRGADSEVSEDLRAGSSRDREDQESSRGHHLQAYDPFEAWEHGGAGATTEFNSASDPSIEALRGLEASRNSSQPSLGLDLSEQTLDDDEDGNDRNAAVAGDKGVEEEMSVTRTAQLYKHACVMHMRASGAQVEPVP